MASELDKFILEYKVEIKDSLTRLEKLNKSVKQVKTESDKTRAAAKDFAADAGEEIGKLVPGVSAVSRAVRALGTEFAIAGVAIGASGRYRIRHKDARTVRLTAQALHRDRL